MAKEKRRRMNLPVDCIYAISSGAHRSCEVVNSFQTCTQKEIMNDDRPWKQSCQDCIRLNGLCQNRTPRIFLLINIECLFICFSAFSMDLCVFVVVLFSLLLDDICFVTVFKFVLFSDAYLQIYVEHVSSET